MSGIKFDPEGFAQAIDDVMQSRADQLQAVYDRVLEAGEGKTLADVKALLRDEWHSTFGTEITDPDLSACAEVLASGRRIEVRRE
jgi:hypothetical protein